MITWSSSIEIYLHRDPVDFRKEVNGLSIIVEEKMRLSLFDEALFVFCNKRRTQIKALYWDKTGFALWQKRLEKDKFKWPRKYRDSVLTLSSEQWSWLLRGFNIHTMKPHEALFYRDCI